MRWFQTAERTQVLAGIAKQTGAVVAAVGLRSGGVGLRPDSLVHHRLQARGQLTRRQAAIRGEDPTEPRLSGIPFRGGHP
jgi:hypothetical protein